MFSANLRGPAHGGGPAPLSTAPGSGSDNPGLALDRERGAWARYWQGWRGHCSTVAPFLWRKLRPLAQPPTAPWSVPWQDPAIGDLRLTGRLRALEGPELLVVVHGLGGSAASGYMPLALAAADRAGVSCLLVSLRGADLSGEDYGHAGLTADLEAVFTSPVLAAYQNVYLLGYSMGGHLALSYAAGQPDPRLRGVVAVSSPLDLDASATAFDRRRSAVYRGHVLSSLKAMYRACHRRRGGPATLEDVRRIGKIRDWDERIVAPRFGFAGARDYYARASVAHRLGQIGIRSLYIGAVDDPMVPAATVQYALAHASGELEVRWVSQGGHLGFSAHTSLGLPGPLGLEHQALSWLRR